MKVRRFERCRPYEISCFPIISVHPSIEGENNVVIDGDVGTTEAGKFVRQKKMVKRWGKVD